MELNLRQVRRLKDITQDELAEKSGVSRTTICELESGKRTTTTTDTLLKLAKALDCKVSELFCDAM